MTGRFYRQVLTFEGAVWGLKQNRKGKRKREKPKSAVSAENSRGGRRERPQRARRRARDRKDRRRAAARDAKQALKPRNKAQKGNSYFSDSTPRAMRTIASRLRSTSSSVVAHDEMLMRMTVWPCHGVPPRQQVSSR